MLYGWVWLDFAVVVWWVLVHNLSLGARVISRPRACGCVVVCAFFFLGASAVFCPRARAFTVHVLPFYGAQVIICPCTRLELFLHF